jgi:hypothetical protein
MQLKGQRPRVKINIIMLLGEGRGCYFGPKREEVKPD